MSGCDSAREPAATPSGRRCDPVCAQVGINTPVTASKSAVRGLHVDVAQEVIAGLFYFRNKADSSRGGSLQRACPWAGADEPLLRHIPHALIPPHAIGPAAISAQVAACVLRVLSAPGVHHFPPREQPQRRARCAASTAPGCAASAVLQLSAQGTSTASERGARADPRTVGACSLELPGTVRGGDV